MLPSSAFSNSNIRSSFWTPRAALGTWFFHLQLELRTDRLVPANFPITRVLEGFAATRREPRTIAGLQLDYSLATRLMFEGGMAKISADHSLGVIARSPLAGGHLASQRLASGLGALRRRDARDRHAAIAAEGIWPALSAIARARRLSPAQVSLSWVLAHPMITSVLVSVSSMDQVRELFTATRFRLASDDNARLGTTSARRSRIECARRNQLSQKHNAS